MLLGCLSLKFLPRSQPAEGSAPNPVTAGVLTFLVIMPLVTVAGIAWQLVLQSVGLPAEPQSLVGLLSDEQPRALVVALTIFAVFIAPVTEELAFRAGLFRFLRDRVPRPVALLAPSMLFASLHVEWSTLDGLAAFGPLVMLGTLFSISYERTGRIAVPMIAHGLFNLNTLVLIYAGVPTEF
jgi:membrane protease YdiL (CAAX protease family)